MANKAIVYYLPSIIWAIVIYSLSTTAPENLPKINLLSIDKIGHLCFYAVLVFLLLYPTIKIHITFPYYTVLSISIAGVYGIVLEWIQAYLPQRSYDYADMIANFTGCMFGYLSFTLYKKYYRNCNS